MPCKLFLPSPADKFENDRLPAKIASYLPTNSTIVSIHADQNILFHSLVDASLCRQFIGFNDEIVDAAFLTTLSNSPPSNPKNGGPEPVRGADDRLAVATNSSLIRIYDAFGLDARLLEGHHDIVLCLDSGNDGPALISGSKDSTARIWAPISVSLSERALAGSGAASQIDRIGNHNDSVSLVSAGNSPASSRDWRCVAICDGHAESVGAVAMARQTQNTVRESGPVPGDIDDHATGRNVRLKFTFTGSQDRTIKMWDLSGVPAVVNAPSSSSSPPLSSAGGSDPESRGNGGLTAPARCRSLFTLKAHEKDINSLDVSPNDRFLASGSQDKTAKVYEIEYSSSPVRGSFKLIGTCNGHKRGVWCVKFGRHEKVLATASGDKTVKLWNLGDFTCIKTFEGHANSVLRVDFLSEGQQLVSSGSDGLVKLWDVRTEECVATMDNHEDKVTQFWLNRFPTLTVTDRFGLWLSVKTRRPSFLGPQTQLLLFGKIPRRRKKWRSKISVRSWSQSLYRLFHPVRTASLTNWIHSSENRTS